MSIQEEYAQKIRECKDPIWRQVLILDKKELAGQEGNRLEVNNWKHIVEVCGSEDDAVAYLVRNAKAAQGAEDYVSL